MRKIALIMDGWKRFFTYAWPAGILERIHETEEDVNLYIFNSSGNWSSDIKYNIGEYNIYNLPDLKEFDGIILELNNIASATVLRDVVQRANAAGVPVVSIANEFEDFYYVGIDNYRAMRSVIEHLHKEHNCKKFWFIMGPENSYESKQRTMALKDYMIENNIPFSEDDFCHGKFDYQSGVRGFKLLQKRHAGIPDAVICVNDNAAVAVCETAAECGYRVPEDFCVTGFDNFDKASFYNPSITTVGYVREEAGYLCADILLKIWAGMQVPKYNYTNMKLVCQESCGCGLGSELNVREHLKGQIMYGIESQEFADDLLALESEMMQCHTVEEMMYCIPQCIPSLKCDGMYLVLDEHINAYRTLSLSEKDNRYFVLSEEGFCEKGYPSKLYVKFVYEKDTRMEMTNIEINSIFPMFERTEGGKDFLFIPLHFGSYTVGYFAVQNAVYLMEKQYLFQMINTLTSSMENLHKRERLAYMNSKLSTLYMMDPLTGMYNRMGYQKLGEDFVQIVHEKKRSVQVFFIDLDRLKYINDTFGHEYGDHAICTIAKAIIKYSSTDAIPARTGGDEFIWLQVYESKENTEQLIRDIRRTLDWEGKKMELPFTLSISVGTIVTDPDSDMTLAEYVKIADERMYEEKLAKKANRK